MPPNYFAGQTPPPGSVRPTRAKPVRSVAQNGQTSAPTGGPVRPITQTGQTSAMVLGSASQPQIAPLPTSADQSLEQELADFVPPYTTKSYDEPSFSPPLPKDVWDDWLRANPQYATQTMSTIDPTTHHFGQTSTGNYEVDLARMREDLANMFKEKLGFVAGRSRIYRRSYVDALI